MAAKDPGLRKQQASHAGQQRMHTMTAEERSAVARAGAAGLHKPVTHARRLARAWPSLNAEDRKEVRQVLKEAGII